MSAKKTNLDNSISKEFGNKLRVRVSGLLYKEEKLLLIKHQMTGYNLWSPPGGGVEFGESIEDTLVREFKEETGIDITVMEFLYLTEYINPPYHAIELFYHVMADDYTFVQGYEPEIKGGDIIKDLQYIGEEELSIIDHNERHSSLKSCTNPIELLDKQGHLK